MHKNILKSEVELDKIAGIECLRAKMRNNILYNIIKVLKFVDYDKFS